jgi:hypothetical protein
MTARETVIRVTPARAAAAPTMAYMPGTMQSSGDEPGGQTPKIGLSGNEKKKY